MAAQTLYDLSPALRLMTLGLAVALGPLAWVWLRNKNASMARRLRVLTLVTLFLTFDLVVFGAFTRLTDSGLGCPDWPGCYGSASPVGAQIHIDAAQIAMPSGPVTHPKAWIEMIHRYLATGVGVLILTLTVATWIAWRDERRVTRSDQHSGQCARQILSPWWPTATLLWVCLQGAFGALTVTMKLFPAIVTLHLLGGLVLLALLTAQTKRHTQVHQEPAEGATASALNPRARHLLIAGFALLWLQIALGGWVSTNYAVLACTDFPTCQSSLWPAMDFKQGFTLWRELGAGNDGAIISFEALTAIHYLHRLVAYLVVTLLLTLAVTLHRQSFHRDAYWLAGLVALQAVTGISNVVLGWPMLAAVLHTAGAGALVVALTGLVFSSRRSAATVQASNFSVSRSPA
jgi:heme a synthase